MGGGFEIVEGAGGGSFAIGGVVWWVCFFFLGSL